MKNCKLKLVININEYRQEVNLFDCIISSRMNIGFFHAIILAGEIGFGKVSNKIGCIKRK
jgi:hypothetical protein